MARYDIPSLQSQPLVYYSTTTRQLTCNPIIADFLLFIPTNSPGLKAVFNYYTNTVKLSSEGDVLLSDEAVTSLGTTLNFLKTSLFGAITQLVQPPREPWKQQQQQTHSDAHLTTQSSIEIDQPPDVIVMVDDDDLVREAEEDDPHIPVQPWRRKERLKLTDLVPDVGYFVAGGLSGITSRTVTAPLDRLKVYLIAQTGNTSEAVSAAKNGAVKEATKQGFGTLKNACMELWAAGGIRSLFAGMSSAHL